MRINHAWLEHHQSGFYFTAVACEAFVWLIMIPLMAAGIVQRLQRPYPQIMQFAKRPAD